MENQNELLKTLEKASEIFFNRVEPPTTKNLLRELPEEKKQKFQEFAQGAYPLLHADVVDWCEQFLARKRLGGTNQEKVLYGKMRVPGFVQRMITKRPLMFMGANDSWLDKSNNRGCGDWDKKANNDLDNFLSYEEIKLSALLQLSTQTFLINAGHRSNCGKPAAVGTFIEEAVYVGAVGARFEKPGKMEYQNMIVDSKDDDSKNQYFYTTEKSALERLNPNQQFNFGFYKQRMQISFETFLLEANKRGADGKVEVYCHVVGLGLGVWQLCSGQEKHWFQAFEDAIDNILKNKNSNNEKRLENISIIDFSWVEPFGNSTFKDGETLKQTDIKIKISKNNPFSRTEVFKKAFLAKVKSVCRRNAASWWWRCLRGTGTRT